MYLQSGNFRGPVYTERLNTLPKFEYSRDCGRLITVENDKSYVGGIYEWKPLSIEDVKFNITNIEFGFGINELNASHIPVKTIDNDTINVQNYFTILSNINKDIKSGKYFDTDSISIDAINLDPLNNGLSAEVILYYDRYHNVNTTPYSVSISDALDYAFERNGSNISIGQTITFNSADVINSDTSISNAIQFVLEKCSTDLFAENIKCTYYSPDPTGKTHCVESDMQTAMNDLSNQFYTHNIIDHLDVQHDWGECGQYLGTCGHTEGEECNCCLNDVHLPLKFKHIRACEILTTVSHYNCLPDAEPEMNLQSLLYTMLNVLCSMWPIGSIFITVSQRNPRELIGYGTWIRIEGKFLLGWSESSNRKVGDVGGEELHQLTVKELPAHSHGVALGGSHSHQFYNGDSTPGSGLHGNFAASSPFSTNTSGAHTHTILNTGGDCAHNNMPPYMVVYMWERVA